MNLEFNKIFAALLVAGITASSASFISAQIMHPHELEEDAVPIEGVASVGGPVAKGPTLPDPIMHLLATADVARGEKLSKACAACHSFDKGGPDRVGPNLWGVVGHSKASNAAFAYSDAMKGMGGAWGYPELNRFLSKPKDYVPGTKMNYIGMKKPEDRAAIIAWLRTLNDSPLALPNEAEIAAEKAALSPEPETPEGETPTTEEAPADAVENMEPAAGDEDIAMPVEEEAPAEEIAAPESEELVLEEPASEENVVEETAEDVIDAVTGEEDMMEMEDVPAEEPMEDHPSPEEDDAHHE